MLREHTGFDLKSIFFVRPFVRLSVVCTFVYPYLIYGLGIRENACSVYLDLLVKLQKKCLRIITFSSYLEHIEPLFKNLEILNF